MLITLSFNTSFYLKVLSKKNIGHVFKLIANALLFVNSGWFLFKKKKKKRPLERGFENFVSYRRNIETFPKLPYTTPFFSWTYWNAIPEF